MYIRQVISIVISFISIFYINATNSNTEIQIKDNPSTETVYEYGDDGRIKEVHHEDGTVECYEYDKNGNLIQITIKTESSNEENTTESSSISTTQNTTGQELTTETSIDDTITTEQKTSKENTGASVGSSSENQNTENKEKNNVNDNNTGDNAKIEVCCLFLIVTIIFLIILHKCRTLGRKKY